jgi:hypothetical protein
VNTKAIGTATSTVAARNDCQKNTSPRNWVDTPVLTGICAVGATNASA